MKKPKDMYNIFKGVSCRINRLFCKPIRAWHLCSPNVSKGFENTPHFLHPFSCLVNKSARAERMNWMSLGPSDVFTYYPRDLSQ